MKDTQKRVLDLLLLHGRVNKTIQDFGRVTPADDGRVRTIMSTAAWTFRLTHSGLKTIGGAKVRGYTNLANISTKFKMLDPLYDIRSVFVPGDGRAFIGLDLSQAEARLAAYLSGDPLAIKQYEEGLDRYRFFAARFYDIPMERITKAQRDCAKMMILACERGIGWRGLLSGVNRWSDLTGVSISPRQAKRGETLFHQLYPFMRKWWAKVLKEAREQGYIRSVTGTRVDFFHRLDSEGAIDKLKRDAVSFLVQEPVARITNRTILEIEHRKTDPTRVRFLLQLHDGLIYDTLEADAESAARLLKKVMEQQAVVTIRGVHVHIPVEVTIGRHNWGEMREI